MHATFDDHSDMQPVILRPPPWVTGIRAKTPEDVAFLSGAALAHLHLVFESAQVPHPLLRERLALRAAVACVAFSGRTEREAGLRDAVNLRRPGDQPGPSGETYQKWRRAVTQPIKVASLQHALAGIETGSIAGWLAAGQGAPVARAAAVLEAVLTDLPRAEDAALILADAALALALGWKHIVPLLAAGLHRRDLLKTGPDLRLACHLAVTGSAIEAVRLSSTLARKAAHLAAVAPKLRAKGAAEAVAIFLSRDAVAPSALPLPDRAARRLCDRLVDLGAVRELTGRDTFRLYGV